MDNQPKLGGTPNTNPNKQEYAKPPVPAPDSSVGETCEYMKEGGRVVCGWEDTWEWLPVK